MRLKAITKLLIISVTLLGIFSCKSREIVKHFSYLNGVKPDSIFESRRFAFPTKNYHLETEYLYPSPSRPVAGRFEKFELGIILPAEINDKIDLFLNDGSVSYLNPYDPEHINMEAVFIHAKDTFKVYGFYFRDYERNLQKNNAWKDKSTDYNWRIRFAPPDTGNWTCNINVSFPNSNIASIEKKNIQFNCIEKSKKGFITVDEDHKHLKYDDTDSNFFVIGQNIAWTEGPFFKGKYINGDNKVYNFKNKNFYNRLFHIGYMDMYGFLENVSSNHGNLVRVISWHDSYLYEWEERGVYGSNRNTADENFKRQKRAWELDQLFSAAELNNIKLLFCLEFQGQYTYDWDGGNQFSFCHNPYNNVVKENKTELKQPVDFFSDPMLIHDYKKKLRYFIARWGYSSSLGIFQFANEFDGWSADSLKQGKKRIHKIIRTDASLQTNIRNWHNEMGTYLHQIAPRPLIVTTGFMGNTEPTNIPRNRNLYLTDGIDMIIHNRYGNDRSQHYIMNQAGQKYLRIFEKPFLYTETGLITDPVNNIDPNDLDGCDDVMFHNFMWAGAMMGSAGTNLNWWMPFDNTRRENYNAAYAFFNSIDFKSNNFTEQDFWSDKGLALYMCGNIQKLISRNSTVEVYYIRTSKKEKEKKQHVYGWAHNLSHYWANLETYRICRDRNNMKVMPVCCGDDKDTVTTAIDTNTFKIKLKGLKPNSTYRFSWHLTRGTGEILKTFTVTSNGSGSILVLWPGVDFDYAFKLEEIETNVLEEKDKNVK